MTHAPREYEDIIDELKVQGWELEVTCGGHYQAFPPDKSISPVHFATSNKSYSRTQAITKLRRCGFTWPPVIQRRSTPTAPVIEAAQPQHQTSPEPMPHPTTPTLTNGSATRHTEPSHEDRLEAFWTALKEARAFVSLTDEHLRERAATLAAASAAYEEAKREHQDAEAVLVARKAEFDKEFGR